MDGENLGTRGDGIEIYYGTQFLGTTDSGGRIHTVVDCENGTVEELYYREDGTKKELYYLDCLSFKKVSENVKPLWWVFTEPNGQLPKDMNDVAIITYDKDTLKPLVGVEIYNNGRKIGLTDTKGKIEFENYPACEDQPLLITGKKEGYLEKTNKQFHDESCIENAMSYQLMFLEKKNKCKTDRDCGIFKYCGYDGGCHEGEPQMTIHFIPVNWGNSINDYNSAVEGSMDFLVGEYPIAKCPGNIKVTSEFERCELDIKPGAYLCNYLLDIENCFGRQPKDHEFIVGITNNPDLETPLGYGCGIGIVFVRAGNPLVTSHEIGHELGLTDQYNKNLNDYPNPLQKSLGCNPNSLSCCWKTCFTKNICCHGNHGRGTSTGRSIMSYGNADGPRTFDVNEYEYLQTHGGITCEK